MAISNEWKKEVHEEYKKKKEQGKPFFPYVVYKDMVAIAMVFAIVISLSLSQGVHLEVVADPTDKTYNPRPEWYFLFLFELLKYFPGSLEIVAIAVIPALIVGFLVLLPFLDRGPKRHWRDRPIFTMIGAAGVAGVVFLSVQGARSPLVNPIIEKNPVVAEGFKLYTEEFRCQSCHSISGKGGTVGPALDTVGLRRDYDWLEQHFRNPQKVSPGSVMPNFGMLDKEAEVLIAYMISLGSDLKFSAAAPKLFEENCSSCHKLAGIGEEVGPDLSGIGLAREQGWLVKFIESPEKVNPDTSMPGFADSLSKEQIEDLSKYLAAQRSAPAK